jgi:hypothetical protein
MSSCPFTVVNFLREEKLTKKESSVRPSKGTVTVTSKSVTVIALGVTKAFSRIGNTGLLALPYLIG